MAVTSIWPIKGHVSDVIKYTRNPEKTTKESLEKIAAIHAVGDVVEYAADEMKTEKLMFVTGVNCQADKAAETFNETRKRWNTKGTRVCYHGYQSFCEGEVDPETANKIGVELAKRLWGDKYEVLVATHCNTNHLHNHIIINAVSFADGTKFHNGKDDYRRMREESDRLCKEYGLSVIRRPQEEGKNYAEWKAEQEGRPTLRGTIREAIDVAIRGSLSKADFLDAMDQMGFIIDQSGKHPKIKHLGNERFVRFDSLGPGYSVEEILDRVYSNMDVEYPDIPPQESPKKIFTNEDGTVSTYGFLSVYRSYYAALLITRERPTTNRKMYFLVREDHNHIASYSEQVSMLAEHHINTADELTKYKEEAQDKIKEITALRTEARNELKRAGRAGNATAVNQIRFNIDQYTRQLNKLRREVSACDQVMEQSERVREKLQIIENEKFRGREGNKNEYKRRSSRPNRENES